MWSLARLGKMHGDLGSIWKNWVKDGVELKCQGVGDDVGHYLPEEAADVIGKAVMTFVDSKID